MKTATKAGILDVLENCTEEDLASIKEQVDEAAKRLAKLQAAYRLVDTALHGSPQARGRAKKKSSADANGHAGNNGAGGAKVNGAVTAANGMRGPKAPIWSRWREAAAELLLRRGLTKPSLIASQCSISESQIEGVLDHPWFEKQADGYALSPAGKQAVG